MNHYTTVADTAQPLSTAAFFERVRTLGPQVAVFDCDGTLWSGDAGSQFMRWSMESGLLSGQAADWLNGRYAGYQRGEVSELEICGEMVQVYRGTPIAALRRAAADFFRNNIEPLIFPAMAELVAALQRRGVEIWAVSSTCDWLIEEGVRRFNVPANRVLAACTETEVCTHGGNSASVATDRLIAVPTDQGKVEALLRAGVAAPDAVFGNSLHDAAMLEMARLAFPVNPSPELAALSAARGWPVYFPAIAG